MKKEEISKKIQINSKIIKGKRLFLHNDFRIIWWGFGELYKWRWHGTHIDLGCISLYGLKSKWWKILGWLTLPLRILYHQLLRKF